MKSFKEQLEHIAAHDHEKLLRIIHKIKDDFGDEIEEYFFCHITSLEMYNEAISHVKNLDGSFGGHWLPDSIKIKSGINFHDKDYTCYDYAYEVNKIYSHIGDIMPEDHIHKYAVRLLEDDDYPGDPSERAYKDAIKMIEYFKRG